MASCTFASVTVLTAWSDEVADLTPNDVSLAFAFGDPLEFALEFVFEFALDFDFDFAFVSDFAFAVSFARAGEVVKAEIGHRDNDNSGKNKSVDVIKRPFKLKVIRLFKAHSPVVIRAELIA